MLSANDIIGDQSLVMPEWLCHEWWLSGVKGFVTGPPKIHNSRIVMDFVFAMATGTKFIGDKGRNKRFSTLYIQNEMPLWMLRDRLVKMVVNKKFNLFEYEKSGSTLTFDRNVGDIPIYFTDDIMMAGDAMQKKIIQPDIIVIDPLYTFAKTDLISRTEIETEIKWLNILQNIPCLLYTSPSPRDS